MSRVFKKSGIPPCARGNTSWLPTQLDVFDRELPVRRENIFSRCGAACGQRVTTYKISSRRDGLKFEEKRGRRKPLASSLLSECLACHVVLVSNIFSCRRSRVRATRRDHKTSSQRAGHGQLAGAWRRAKWVLARQEYALAAPLARAFSAPACARFHESRYRDETYTLSRDESNHGGQRTQNGTPVEETGDKDPNRDSKSATCRNRAETRAPARVK